MKNSQDIITVIIAVLTGGFLKVLREKEEKITIRKISIGLITSAFVGYIIYFLLEEYHISDNLKPPILAISGYISHNILDLIEKYSLNYAKEKLRIKNAKK